jgi:hypothetical protein
MDPGLRRESVPAMPGTTVIFSLPHLTQTGDLLALVSHFL